MKFLSGIREISSPPILLSPLNQARLHYSKLGISKGREGEEEVLPC
jgi:hypothetical protein